MGDLRAVWGAILGPSWGLLGGHFSSSPARCAGVWILEPMCYHLHAIFGASWAIFGDLGPVWGDRGLLWGHLGPCWGRLGAVLGPSWGRLGAVLGHPRALKLLRFRFVGRSWATFGDLGPILGPSPAILAHLPRSWAILGPFWRRLGPSWGRFGGVLRPSWGLLGAF